MRIISVLSAMSVLVLALVLGLRQPRPRPDFTIGMGLFLTQMSPEIIDELKSMKQTTGLNTIFLTIKDANGFIFYKGLPKKRYNVPDRNRMKLKTAISLLHDAGFRVLARIAAFKDKELFKHPMVKSKFTEGYLDPQDPFALEYLRFLIAESRDAGADEIVMDYFRYPSKHHQDSKNIEVINRVFAELNAEFSTLSINIFGHAAVTPLKGIGQDGSKLAKSAECIMPMIYPELYKVLDYVSGDEVEFFPFHLAYAVTKNWRTTVSGDGCFIPMIQGYERSQVGSVDFYYHQMAGALEAGANGFIFWTRPIPIPKEVWQALKKFARFRSQTGSGKIAVLFEGIKGPLEVQRLKDLNLSIPFTVRLESPQVIEGLDLGWELHTGTVPEKWETHILKFDLSRDPLAMIESKLNRNERFIYLSDLSVYFDERPFPKVWNWELFDEHLKSYRSTISEKTVLSGFR